MHSVFSYGTLRLPAVQVRLFGRLVDAVEDSLPGFRLGEVLITDPEVIEASGTDRHPLLVRATSADSVAGLCLFLSDDLAAADDYEVDDYRRVEVALGSGRRAWVYASAREADELVTWPPR